MEDMLRRGNVVKPSWTVIRTIFNVSHVQSVAERLSARVMCLDREHAQMSRATGCEARGWNVNRGATMGSTKIHAFSLHNRVMGGQVSRHARNRTYRAVYSGWISRGTILLMKNNEDGKEGGERREEWEVEGCGLFLRQAPTCASFLGPN